MNPKLKFHVTHHMAVRMAERGVSLEYAKNVVHYAENERKLRDGAHGGFVKMFTKTDSGRTLVVVAELKNNDCWLATAYYED